MPTTLKRPRNDAGWLDAECLACAEDLDRFNSVVLGRSAYWSKQREICESIRDYRTTVVVTGNGVGKSYHGAGVVLGFSASRPGSKTVASAPTLGQLTSVLWSEVQAAYRSAEEHGLPLGGRLKSLVYDLGENWRVEGFGSGSVESKSGRHAADLCAIIDEASGVPAAVLEAIDSLNPSRYVLYGNPLRPEGKFYELAELSGDNPTVNVIRIPSLESPDIDLERSPRGMADRGWLDDARAKYGEDSLWWLSHVLAKFPNTISEGLLPIPWLNLAAATIHVPGGDVWIGVDIGEGTGGDPSEIVARDDNGIVAWDSSNQWSLETLAERVADVLDKTGGAPARVIYDQVGIGADFENRLRAAGLIGCKGYKGSRDGGDKFLNLRAACGWQLRRRLDPKRTTRAPGDGANKRALWVPQKPFALPRHLLDRYRAELQGLTYSQTPRGEIALEAKEAFVKRLKRSPNFLDAWMMTYAYPYA